MCRSCGSSMGNNTVYANSAKFVAEALARERIPIIYGGGRLGIMGEGIPKPHISMTYLIARDQVWCPKPH